MKTITFMLILILTGAISQSGVAHAELAPRDILLGADKKRGNKEGIELVIQIDAVERGRKIGRTIRVKTRELSALVEYIKPAKMKGTRILRHGRNIWFSKPGLKKPFAISSRQRLVGQASNGDITSTDYAGDYEANTVTEVILGSEPCYLMDLRAVHKEVTYDKIRYWVSKEKLRAVRAEFFSVSGRKFKTASFEYDNTMLVEGQPHEFISKMVITDAINKQNVTTMRYSNIKFKKHPDSIFNINLLLR